MCCTTNLVYYSSIHSTVQYYTVLYSTGTGGRDKRTSELDVLLKITQNNNKQNDDMYNRHDTHRISSKINREIFLKIFDR